MSDLDANASGGALPAWRERKNLLLAGAVGVAILVLGAYFLVFSGSGGDEDLGPVTSAAAGGAGKAATPTASASPAETLPEEESDADVFGDPFAPLYPAVATTAAAATVTPPPAQTDANTGGGNGGGSVAVQTTPPQTEQPPAKQSVSLRLIRIVDEDTVVVRVNGKAAQIAEKGVEFGGYFALKSTRTDENEATFAYGSEDFTLVVGELKKF